MLYSHSTLVANSTLVPTAPPIIGPASYSSTPVGRAPNSASGGFSSPSQRCNAPSRVLCIRDNLEVRQRNFSKGSQLFAQVMAFRDRKAVLSGLEMFFSFVAVVIGNREFLFKQIQEQFAIFSQNNLRTLKSHIVQLILTDLHYPLCYYLQMDILWASIPLLLAYLRGCSISVPLSKGIVLPGMVMFC